MRGSIILYLLFGDKDMSFKIAELGKARRVHSQEVLVKLWSGL